MVTKRMTTVMHDLTANPQLFSRSEVLSKPSPVPAESGIYAWYFRDIPEGVPTENCHMIGDLTLLYVGISPVKSMSAENLKKRVQTHYRGNAWGSNIRLTLGVLLENQSGYPLRRVGSGNRRTFTHLGERWLDSWMERNAFVCWSQIKEPWNIEAGVIGQIDLPLNNEFNTSHPYASELSRNRVSAKNRAVAGRIADETGTSRSG